MKRVLCLFYFLIFGASLLVACINPTINAPTNVNIENDILSFSGIEGVEEYEIWVNDVFYVRIRDLIYSFDLEDGLYTIKVRAYYEDKITRFSKDILYVKESLELISITYMVFDEIFYSERVLRNNKIEIIDNIPNVDNYLFIGWDYDFDIFPTKDIIINAVFEENVYKVIYYVFDEIFYIDELNYNFIVNEYEFIPYVNGYKFLGWDFKFGGAINNDIEIHALFELINEVRVDFDVNGGSSINSINLFVDKEYSLPIPSRDEYYYFMGWYYNGNKIDNKGIWKFDNDVILTARWQGQLVVDNDGYIVGMSEHGFMSGKIVIPLLVDGPLGFDSLIIRGIRQGAFSNITSLYSLTLSSSISLIEKDAFVGCVPLVVRFLRISNITINDDFVDVKAIIVPDNKLDDYKLLLPKVAYKIYSDAKTIDNKFIIDDSSKLVFYYGTEEGNIHIPEGILDYQLAAFFDSSIWVSAPNNQPIIVGNKIVGVKGYVYGIYTIPSGVVAIGESAFEDQIFLTEINFPSSGFTTIELKAFENCISLLSVTLPSSVNMSATNSATNIRIFYNCISLQTVNMGAIVSASTFIPRYAFGNCTSLVSVILPTNLTTIDFGAFSNCTSLIEIALPSTITTLNQRAFEACNELIVRIARTTISTAVGSNNALIDVKAVFVATSALSTYRVNASFSNIAYKIFGLANALTTPIPNEIIEGNTFMKYLGTNTNFYALPSGITTINREAFAYNKSLETIDLPVSLTTIEANAFLYCFNLTNINLMANVSNIGEYAFGFCYNLNIMISRPTPPTMATSSMIGVKLILVPDANLTAYKNSFSFLSDIIYPNSAVDTDDMIIVGNKLVAYLGYNSSVTIPNHVTIIGENAFKNNISITNVNFTNVEIIEANAFLNCKNLNNLTIPSSVISIGNNAFSGCSLLSIINVANGLVSIGSNAFNGCTSLSNITIPISVLTIGNNAFYNTAIYNNALNDTLIYHSNWILARKGNPGVNIVVNFGTRRSASGVFANWDTLEYIEFLNGFEAVDEYSFTSCTRLRKVILPSSVESIEEGAFINCVNLVLITVGSSLTYIKTNAFVNCPNVSLLFTSVASVIAQSNTLSNVLMIIVPNANLTTFQSMFNAYTNKIFAYTTILNDDYIINDTNLVRYVGFSSCITIPSNIVSISGYSFTNHAQIMEMTIPLTTTKIESGAFSGLNLLHTLTTHFLGEDAISTDSDYIGFWFGGSNFNQNASVTPRSLKIVNITGDSDIMGFAFYNCAYIKEINLLGNVVHINDYAFYGCKSLENVILPFSVKRIESYAFYDCNKLNDLDFSNSLEFIGNNAFAFCSKLNTITFSEKLLSIGNNAFESCSNLVEVIIPSTSVLISIGNSAFSNCSSLYSINLPISLISIGDRAFYNCISLSNMIFPEGLLTIGNYAFYGNFALRSIYIPSSLITLGAYSFQNCSNLTSVDFGTFSRITNIDAYTFSNCTSLDNFIIPENVSTLGIYVFENCTSLINITWNNKISSIGNYAFTGCTKLAVVILPTSIKSLGNYVFRNCSSLTSVTIPASATSVGSYIFQGCSNLNAIVFGFISNLLGIYFSTTSFANSVLVSQQTSATASANYYIPTSLKNVTVLKGTLSYGVFSNCTMLENINIGDEVILLNGTGDRIVIGTTNYNNAPNNSIIYVDDIAVGYKGTLNGVISIVEGTREIAANAFYNCSGITDVIIPSSVISIGHNAFFGTAFYNSAPNNAFIYKSNWVLGVKGSITGVVNIPTDCLGIQARSFYNMSNITSLNIPSGVRSIGNDTFYNLTNCVFTMTPANFVKVGNNAFQNCRRIDYNMDLSNCVFIGANAFYGCNQIVGVTLSNDLKFIRDNAFRDCSQLVVNNMSTSIIEIGQYAFANTKAYTNIVFSSSISFIGQYAFSNISTLNSVVFSNGSNPNFDAYVFANNANLTNITLSNKTTSLSNYFASNCPKLASITFGEGIREINNYSFYQTGLVSITLPSSTHTIGTSAFQNCVDLVNVTFNNSLYKILDNAFNGCSKLNNVMLPDSLIEIGISLFTNCIALDTMYIPANEFVNTYIGNYNLFHNTKVFNDALNNSFVYLGGWLVDVKGSPTGDIRLADNDSKGNLVIGVLPWAGYGSYNNVNITIPNTYKIISFSAFSNMSGSNINITFEANSKVEKLGAYAFSASTGLVVVNLPDKLLRIEDRVFNNCTSLTMINLPNTLRYIGSYAFAGCISMSGTLNIPASVYELGSFSFNQCSAINTVFTASGLIRINASTFSNMIALTTITLPGSLCFVGASAITNCTNLTQIRITKITSIPPTAYWSATWASSNGAVNIIWGY